MLGLPLQLRTDPGVMEMKGYSSLRRVQELDPLHQMTYTKDTHIFKGEPYYAGDVVGTF